MKEEIRVPGAPAPAGPYAQALRVGSRIYVAGQRPQNPVSGEMPAGITAQSRQLLENVKTILAAAGAAMDTVVKSSVFLADLDDFAAFNAVYAEYFSPPYPVRTTVGCSLRGGMLVEMDVIAEL
jgi:reactive intermediate/imine deaminase